jgi:hypothetical protein
MATIINIFSSPVSWIIVGLALFNIFEWFGTKHTIAKLVEINRPEANIRIGRQANMNITDGCVDDLIKYSKDASKKYTLYINITAVFPLLGILGTVISLMNLSIAIQEIIKEYQRQKTNQRSRKGGSARKPQQYHAEAEVII